MCPSWFREEQPEPDIEMGDVGVGRRLRSRTGSESPPPRFISPEGLSPPCAPCPEEVARRADMLRVLTGEAEDEEPVLMECHFDRGRSCAIRKKGHNAPPLKQGRRRSNSE